MVSGSAKIALAAALGTALMAPSPATAQAANPTVQPRVLQKPGVMPAPSVQQKPRVMPAPRVVLKRPVQSAATKLPKALPQNQASKFVVKPDESDWYFQGGTTADAPAIVALGADRMGLGYFIHTDDGNLAWRTKGATINPWKTLDLGGVVASAPSCISRWENGDIVECFFRRTDNSVEYAQLTNGALSASATLPRSVQNNGLQFAPSVSRVGNNLIVWSLDESGFVVGLPGYKSPLAGGGYTWGSRFQGFDSHITYEYDEQFYTMQPSCTDSYDPNKRDLYCYSASKKNNRFEEIQEFKEGGGNITNYWADIPPYAPGLASTKPYSLNGQTVVQTIFVLAAPGGVTMTLNMNQPNPETRTVSIGGTAASGARCVMRGAAMANAQFACAVRRGDGSVWVRELQLAE
ncbi:MAG: hypothetical protein ACXWI5_00640 [Croceibacterium sp.]